MIIGIDASRANKTHKSGTEWYSYYLIKYFAQLDPDNQYILYTDEPIQGGLLDLKNMETEVEHTQKGEVVFDSEGYQIIESPHDNFKAKVLNWPFRFFWTLGRLTLEMISGKKVDVLFIPAHGLPLFMPKRTINTIHDVAFKRSKKLYFKEELGSDIRISQRIINFFVRIITLNKHSSNSVSYLDWSTKFATKKAKRIITVSNATKQDILSMYDVDEEKIEVIYNGYNHMLYKKHPKDGKEDEVLRKYGIKKPYILYVGRLEEKKNTPALIEAFAHSLSNDDFKENLVLLGNAGYGFDRVKYNIAEYDLNKSVYIPGWVEEKDMPYFYNAATAFIFPSKYEGFGIPILQAFACGVPVISSCIPPFREIGRDAIMYFNPDDIYEMSSCITKIAKNRELRESLSKKGSERVRDFSWEKCARETLDLIKRV